VRIASPKIVVPKMVGAGCQRSIAGEPLSANQNGNESYDPQGPCDIRHGVAAFASIG
jgi:hypothetical protein